MRQILVCMRSAGSAQRSFIAGVSEYAHAHGDWSIRFDPCPEKLTPAAFLDAVASGIAGAIVCETGIPRLGQTIRTTPVPLVVFGTMRPEFRTTDRRIGFATSDDVGIGELAADHLLSLGAFRSFGYVPDPDGAGWSSNRLRGFRLRLAAAGRKPSSFRSCGSASDRRMRLRKWIEALPKPAAVMAACDYLGAEVLEICRLASIDVPRAVSVIGVDNDTLVDEMAVPALTSISANHMEEGRLASTLLARLMRGPACGKAKTVQGNDKKVVVRGSTQYVTTSAGLVSRATDYIESNADQPLRADDIARHLGVSRRLLDRRFAEFQNETVNETILRIRLAEVRRRLLSSSLPISRIAENCGFPNPSYLKKLFFARYGEQMDSFRRHAP